MAEDSHRKRFAFWGTKLGLTIITVILAPVVLALIGWGVSAFAEHQKAEQQQEDARLAKEQKDLEQARQSKLVALAQNEERARSVRQLIDDAILKRVAATELMIQIFHRRATDAEMEETWSNYWQAYHDYFLFRIGNEIPLDRKIGKNADYLNKSTPVLWNYLDYVIDPEFERVNDCIVTAHDGLGAKSDAAKPALFDQLQACISAKVSANAFWLEYDHPRWGEPNPWKKFKICIGSFALELEYSLQFREQLDAEDPVPASGSSPEPKHCLPGYDDPNPVCRQKTFNDALASRISDDCGPQMGTP